MPFEHMQKQAEVARHLPPPLYVLLVQVGAYGQACGTTRIFILSSACMTLFFWLILVYEIIQLCISDKNLSVSISGDVDEAKALSRPPEDSQGTCASFICVCDGQWRLIFHVCFCLRWRKWFRRRRGATEHGLNLILSSSVHYLVARVLMLSFPVQKRRRATVGAQLDDKRKGMLRRHPLSLCVDLKCKGAWNWCTILNY